MQRLMILFATCSLSMSVSGAARAQSPGELDPVFGLEAGLTATAMPNETTAGDVVAMTDGGWVVSARVREPDGDKAFPILTRYSARGIPVAAFGVNGVATGAAKVELGGELPVLFDGIRLYQVAVDAQQILVLAYTLQGVPDPTYGVGGIATIQAGKNTGLLVDAVLQGGRVLIAGSGHDGISSAFSQFLLARLTSSGHADLTFGAGGRRYYQIHSGTNARNLFTGVALQADGKIVAAGRAAKPSADLDMAVARFDSNGEPDATFWIGGFRVFSLVDVDNGRDVVVQGDGKLVIAGTICAKVNAELATDFCMLGAVRLLPNGHFDPSFGAGGRAMHWLPPIDGQPAEYSSVFGLEVDSQGRVLLLGQRTGSIVSALIARLTSDGSLDSTFGEGGVIRNAYGETVSGVLTGRLLLLPSGERRLITVGFRNDAAGTSAIVIARHLYDDPATTVASK